MSKVLEGLYLGDSDNAFSKEWLLQHHITHVVNCAKEHKNYHQDICNYIALKLDDDPDQSLYPVLEKSYRFIRSAIQHGGNVLVHCHAGISRSASVVIYYLMKSKKLTFKQALEYAKSRRSIVDPNEGFVAQLISVTPAAKRPKPQPLDYQPSSHPYVMHAQASPRFDKPMYLEGVAQIHRNITKKK